MLDASWVVGGGVLRYAGCGMRFALSVISVGGVISGSCLAFMVAVECVGVRSDRTCPLSGRSGNIRLNGLLVGVKAPSPMAVN